MNATPRILVLFFHPYARRSYVNQGLRSVYEGYPEIQVRDLYELYPNHQIDVDREKAHVINSDLIVFQHPVYWYSCPSLMKEWIDIVLEKGWAYGDGGTHLTGKYWLQVVSAGGPETAYSHHGYNEFTIHEFFRPFERTARLCGMKPLAPFVVHGVHPGESHQLEAGKTHFRSFLGKILKGDLLVPYTTGITHGTP